jgi:hypothetical protein
LKCFQHFFKHEGTKAQRHEVFLFHAKLAKEQGRKDFETHGRRFFNKKDAKSWKMIPTF